MSLELIEKTDKVKESLVSLSVRDVYGSFDINLSHEEVIVLCLVKNGEQYVRDFIKYYLDLGVKHIVFLDNGSGDQTLELIKKYEWKHQAKKMKELYEYILGDRDKPEFVYEYEDKI